MKYCEECGTKLRNDAEFCYRCAAPCPDIRDEALYLDRLSAYRRKQKLKEKEESSGGAGRIAGSVILILLLIAFGFFVWYCPARRCYQYAVNGEKEAAEALFRESVSGNTFESFLLRCFVPRGAKAVVKAYEEGTVSYQDATMRIQTLAEFEAPLNNAARAGKSLQNLYKSEEAWNLARKSEESGDLRSALLAYRLVAKEDSRYESAVRKAAELEEAYRSSVLTSIGVPETESEYHSAVASIEDALLALPGDLSLTEALKVLKQNFAVRLKAKTVPLVTDYISQGYYKQAIELSKNALRYQEQDADLKTLLATATADYEEFARGQVSIYLANNDKAGAIAFLERVRADLPGDAVIEQLWNEVNSR